MTQPLFLEPEEYTAEKVAAETRLPEDPNQWPQAVLQELYKQVPYISDFQPHINMSKVDGEKGYGFGHVEVSNQTEAQADASAESQSAAGIQKIRIPIIIEENSLSPFDLMLTPDSKVLPLTEDRLRSNIFRPQAFDVTGVTPGDQSMIGQLYPPFRDSAVLGGSGVIAPGAAKEAEATSLLEGYLLTESPSKNENPKAKAESSGPGFSTGKKGQGLDEPGMSDHLPESSLPVVGELRSGGGEEGPMAPAGPTSLKNTRSEKDAPAPEAKTASAFEEYYRSQVKHGRLGKKEASGELSRFGVLDEFIAKHASSGQSLLEAIVPQANRGDLDSFREFCMREGVQMRKNAAAMYSSVKLLLETHPQTEKMASAEALIIPQVKQLVRTDDGYVLKTASSLCWDPKVVKIARGEAVRRMGEKVVLAADMEGAATVADTPMPEAPSMEDSDMSASGPVEETGVYRVWTSDGQELVGIVAANLVDIDGKELPLALFTNGSQTAVQADIVGTPMPEATGSMSLPTGDVPQGSGVFFGPGMEGDQVTIPLTIKASFATPGTPTAFQAETFDGRPIAVAIHEGAQQVIGDGATMMIPGSWEWSPLGSAQPVSLATAEPEDPAENAEGMMPPEAPEASGGPMAPAADAGTEGAMGNAGVPVQKTAGSLHGFVTVRSSGPGSFTFSGAPVEKLAASERADINIDEAMFLLAGLGTNMEYGVKKLAQAMSGRRPEKVKIARAITTMDEQRKYVTKVAKAALAQIPDLKKNLWKEAAQLPDPAAVDTVLSLGFLNPENVTTFVGYLPQIDETQQKLCELLLAARLGQGEIPEPALEASVRALEETIVGLKSMAFQGL